MKFIPATPDLLHILRRCSQYAKHNVNALENAPEYGHIGSVGDIIRVAAEIAYQDVALLEDLVRRYSEK